MQGSITISPHVLADIISHAVLEIPGVARMGTVPAKQVATHFRGAINEPGVVLRVEGAVSTDLYLVANDDVNLLDLGTEIQATVARTMTEMVGLPVEEINVVIQDVEARHA
ncbi:MAG: hypothetical protein NVS4B8_23520 [Herpetosiphon sp.]